MNKNHKLIVIEGVDSSGKATQSKLLKERLSAEFQNVSSVEFPNYKSDSSSVVKMYLNGDFGTNPDDVNPYMASAFFAVDRIASVRGEWKNTFSGDNIVIADRYTTSNMVHQASKINDEEKKLKFLDWLYDFEYNKLEIPKPDIVIFLDMPVPFAEKLMAERANKIDNSSVKDIHERNTDYLKHSYDNAICVAKKYNWNIVPCVCENKVRSIDDISDEIYLKVKNIL